MRTAAASKGRACPPANGESWRWPTRVPVVPPPPRQWDPLRPAARTPSANENGGRLRDPRVPPSQWGSRPPQPSPRAPPANENGGGGGPRVPCGQWERRWRAARAPQPMGAAAASEAPSRAPPGPRWVREWFLRRL